MIKVLIVDDELLVRTNLKLLIDWEFHGFVICGEASNGQEALGMIERLNPDLVITDMEMPLMDGEELMQQLKSAHPEVVCIVLSNYDSFDFVRCAMKNGAIDYMLKHRLTPQYVLEILNRSKETLKSQRNKSRPLDRNNLMTLRNKFLTELLAGLNNKDDIQNFLSFLDINLHTSNICTIIMLIDNFNSLESRLHDSVLFQFATINIVEELLKENGNGAVCHVANEQFVIFLSFESIASASKIEHALMSILSRVRMAMNKYLNVAVSFGGKSNSRTVPEIKHNYEKAFTQTSEQRFYQGRNTLLLNNDSLSTTEFAGLELDLERKLMTSILEFNIEQTLSIVEDIFASIVRNKMNIYGSRLLLGDLVSIANRLCKENKIELHKLYNNQSPSDIIMSFASVDDAKHWFVEMYLRLTDEMKHLSGFAYHPYVNQAIRYINKNYAAELTLDAAAKQINISHVYLSKLFKENVGVGFTEYLNDIRLGKAASLLDSSDYSLREVAKMCGFHNYSYFFKVFKKKYGNTPKQQKQLSST